MTYKRTTNGVTEFTNGVTIQTRAGEWISNPTPEMLKAEGWEEYTAPVAESTAPSLEEKVKALGTLMTDKVVALDDETALLVTALFPTWAEAIGREVKAGERFFHADRLWRVVQTHIASEEWKPTETPALWCEVSVAEFPEWKQPSGAQDAYAKGDRVSYDGRHYESLVDANVWLPNSYGWVEIDQ